jgi:hypothetical protein
MLVGRLDGQDLTPINIGCLIQEKAPDYELVFDPDDKEGCGSGGSIKLIKHTNGCCEEDTDQIVEMASICVEDVLTAASIYEANSAITIVERDAEPDDPDFPWYYGNYNENAIDLKLDQFAEKWFGKFPLQVTIEYGFETTYCGKFREALNLKPPTDGYGVNVANMRSIVFPFTAPAAAVNPSPDPAKAKYHASVLEGPVTNPWGTNALRSSMTIFVPKGEKAYLRHEVRVRTQRSIFDTCAGGFEYNATWDGKKAQLSGINDGEWIMSRLNQLRYTVRPVFGAIEKIDYAASTVERPQMDQGPTGPCDQSHDLIPNKFMGV